MLLEKNAEDEKTARKHRYCSNNSRSIPVGILHLQSNELLRHGTPFLLPTIHRLPHAVPLHYRNLGLGIHNRLVNGRNRK